MDLVSPQRKNNIQTLWVAGGWGFLFIAAVVAYWPGLSGPFLLDDFGTIAALGDRGGVVDWETFKAFVFGGSSGPTGRPISLLSFLLDAQNWPAESWSFKRTNLGIHLLNAAILGVVTFQVLRVVRYDASDATWIALMSTAFWLLHPFLVSTTLYVVQRMAQLSTLFVLIGISVYIHGRSRLRASPMKSYLTMSAAVGFGTLLALLSKENGILLPLLVVVLELTIFASQHPRIASNSRIWFIVFAAIPASAIILYLGSQVLRADFFEIVPPRDFSLYERLLTESRVLVDYLQNWFIPKLYTSGVFQDHFLKSTGVLAPATTAIAILFHLFAITLAFVNRRRRPIFALAVLFFYGGHLIESTVLNLELYFEHRNYLAAVFLFLPVATVARAKLSPQLFVTLLVMIAIVLAGFTRYSSTVWSSYPSMVEASARKAPTSARAQAEYSVLLYGAGQYDESLRVLDRAKDLIPSVTPLLDVNRLVTLCKMNQLEAAEFDQVANTLSAVPYDARLIRAYMTFVDAVIAGECAAVDALRLNELFTRMLQVPRNADRSSLEYSHIMYLIGVTDASSGHRQKSVAAFEESIAAQPGASLAMQMAAILASSGFLDDALRFSEIALAELADSKSLLNVAPINEADVRAFQANVRSDLEALEAEQGADTSGPNP